MGGVADGELQPAYTGPRRRGEAAGGGQAGGEGFGVLHWDFGDFLALQYDFCVAGLRDRCAWQGCSGGLTRR